MTPSYLIDTSAVFHMFSPEGHKDALAWREAVEIGAVGMCAATRAEFLYSARSPDDRDRWDDLFDTTYPSVAIPKGIWSWIDTAQYRMTRAGQHRSTGVLDLIVAGTAAHHGLAVLHRDRDFVTASRVLPDVRECDVRAASG